MNEIRNERPTVAGNGKAYVFFTWREPENSSRLYVLIGTLQIVHKRLHKINQT